MGSATSSSVACIGCTFYFYFLNIHKVIQICIAVAFNTHNHICRIPLIADLKGYLATAKINKPPATFVFGLFIHPCPCYAQYFVGVVHDFGFGTVRGLIT